MIKTKGQDIYECQLWDILMHPTRYICPKICIPFFMEPLIKSEYNPGNINLCTEEEYICIANKFYWGIISHSETCPSNAIGKA